MGLGNMPDFNLGPLDGSSCDTLGLDNPLNTIRPFTADKDFSIYPNPSTGLIKINGPQNFEGVVIIRNVNGQHLKSYRYQPTMDLDLSDSSGVLFLSWIDNAGKVVHTHRQIILE